MLSIQNLSMRFGGKILFKNVFMQLQGKERVGLIGPNGAGKSTFLKVLLKELEPESGDIYLPSELKIGTLPQDHFHFDAFSPLDVVIMGKKELWKALEERDTLTSKKEFGEDEIHALSELDKIIEKEEGYAAKSQAAALLSGLGIEDRLHQAKMTALSGGMRIRVLLAQLFFAKPDILLLDEPTNHLDLASILWLEQYLVKQNSLMILSSHDAHFLNSVCTSIADLDYQTIRLFKGNYSDYLAQRTLERETMSAQLEKQETKKAHAQKFIDRFKATASKARQANSREKFIEKLEEEISTLNLGPSSRIYPSFTFNQAKPSGAIALHVKDLSKSYGEKKVLDKVSFEVMRGEKIAILGPNGIGKTTLLEIIMGRLKPDSGVATVGFAVHPSYFPQNHHVEVHGDISLLDWIAQWVRPNETLPTEQKRRDVLGRALFTKDKAKLPVEKLSGGEMARLLFAKIMMLEPNLIVLDEPTNHLDMEAIVSLTEALKTYPGTLIFVSHNRDFVSKIADRIIAITPAGVHDYKGTFDEYLSKKGIDFLAGKNLETAVKEKTQTAPLPRKKKGNIRKVEDEIALLEKKLSEHDQKIASLMEKEPNEFKKHFAEIEKREEIETKLREMMQLWEEMASAELS